MLIIFQKKSHLATPPKKKKITRKHVMSRLDDMKRTIPSEMIGSIIASVTIPNVIFVISLIVLLYWYCPYCQAKFHKYDEQIDQEGHEDDDDE